MKWVPWILLVAMLSPFVPAGAQLPASAREEVPPGPPVDERVFVLLMTGTEFNGLSWPNTPLLEAYAGEAMTFIVAVPATAVGFHTFHLHGHPWWDNEQDRFIDNKLLAPGQDHTFTVQAGTIRGHAGDWLYHCHVDNHFDQGMFGILRVYPYALTVRGPLDQLDITVHRDGDPVPPTDLRLEMDGEPIEADVDPAGENRFHVTPHLPEDAEGELVIHADNALGHSLARLSVQDGGYDLIRHVIPEDAPEVLGDALPSWAEDDVADDPTTQTIDALEAI